jgi:ATP-dependent Clp protease ATP-binding subunit ClpA
MNSSAFSAARIAILTNLEAKLTAHIRGQSHVISRVVSVLQRGELGLTSQGRPRGSFLFLGPTGTGKTELAITFTHELFGAGRLHRFDMSEYQTQENLGILLGAHRNETGTLAYPLTISNQGTLLFDEIEKAHPRVLDIFLQILDAARVTMATGETLDFSNYYIVFTSNIAAAELLTLQHSTAATMERHVLAKAQQTLRPELFARITEKLVFHPLGYETQIEIAKLLIQRELEQQSAAHLEVSNEALQFIIQHGYHPRLGARPMRDTIEKFTRDAIARQILNGGSLNGTLRVSEDKRSLCIS